MYMKKIILYIILLNLILTQTVISGFITNEQTGEALIGANVFIPEMKIGITSDKNGFYSILIEERLPSQHAKNMSTISVLSFGKIV